MNKHKKIQWIGQQARQEWQKSHKRSWNKSAQHGKIKARQKENK